MTLIADKPRFSFHTLAKIVSFANQPNRCQAI